MISQLDTNRPRRILGVDPGTNVLGYTIIEVVGKSPEVLILDILRIPPDLDHHGKLERIFRELSGLIRHFNPQEMAIEAPFFGKNVQSMLKLGRAQGVAIAAGMSQGLQVAEYSPRKIKQAVTGKGNADKTQVAAMLPHIIKGTIPQVPLDATDALATAICHFFQSNLGEKKQRSYTNWSAFIKDNPSRQA